MFTRSGPCSQPFVGRSMSHSGSVDVFSKNMAPGVAGQRSEATWIWAAVAVDEGHNQRFAFGVIKDTSDALDGKTKGHSGDNVVCVCPVSAPGHRHSEARWFCVTLFETRQFHGQ